ncbi:hypothetical protein KC711_07925, partial [Candidatus Peregrinibacteria bacterium]|nr:hypothetical protein [Candidatus Peregrinibacteria bacterium]
MFDLIEENWVQFKRNNSAITFSFTEKCLCDASIPSTQFNNKMRILKMHWSKHFANKIFGALRNRSYSFY